MFHIKEEIVAGNPLNTGLLLRRSDQVTINGYVETFMQSVKPGT